MMRCKPLTALQTFLNKQSHTIIRAVLPINHIYDSPDYPPTVAILRAFFADTKTAIDNLRELLDEAMLVT
jgi:hypothetical protein